MATKVDPQIPLADAQRVASELAALLANSCEQLVIAGSVRRQKQFVSDLEIVAEPKMVPRTGVVFNTGILVSALDARLRQLLADGSLMFDMITRRNGDRYKR